MDEDKVVVIGLGYVGLPLLLQGMDNDVNIHGFDIDESKITALNKGESPIADESIQRRVKNHKEKISVSKDEEILLNTDYFIITVPTPVDGKTPNYDYVIDASNLISKHLSEGATVILESTVAPGTCREKVAPALETNGLEAGENFHLAFCPERVDPGNQKWDVSNIPRVLGAITEKGCKKAKKFYDDALEAEIHEVDSIEVAEASKVVENTFRDINIAFVNELAQIFDNIDISTREVINAANTKPFGFMPHWPGAGVGGHCIPVDPYYLIQKSQESGKEPEFLSLARKINNQMPQYTVSKVIEGLNQHSQSVKGSKITLLGYAYKGGVDDERQSPAKKIKKELERLGAHVEIYDPYISKKSDFSTLEDALSNDYIILATDHEEFEKINSMSPDIKLLVDGRGVINSNEADYTYMGVGN